MVTWLYAWPSAPQDNQCEKTFFFGWSLQPVFTLLTVVHVKVILVTRTFGEKKNNKAETLSINQSGSARVSGYTVYRGFWNRVYGILQLKYGYSAYHFLWISGIKYTYLNFGYIWMNFGHFWVFWRIFFGDTGIPLPPLADPDQSNLSSHVTPTGAQCIIK